MFSHTSLFIDPEFSVNEPIILETSVCLFVSSLFAKFKSQVVVIFHSPFLLPQEIYLDFLCIWVPAWQTQKKKILQFLVDKHISRAASNSSSQYVHLVQHLKCVATNWWWSQIKMQSDIKLLMKWQVWNVPMVPRVTSICGSPNSSWSIFFRTRAKKAAKPRTWNERS